MAFAALSALGLAATRFGHLGAGQAGAGDLALAASVPIGVAAVAFLPGGPRYLAGVARTLVDGLIVGCSLLLVGWQTGLGDLYAQHATRDYRLVLAHAVGYVVIASMVVVMATRARTEARPRLIWFAGGFGCLAAADTVFAWLRLSDPSAALASAIAVWVVGWSLVTLTAARTFRTQVDEGPGLPTRASVFVPSVPFAIALAAVAAEAADGHGFDGFVAWSALAVALLVVARQVLALLENISFWRDLEAKVKARTVELRRSEARFRSLVQNSSDVITAIDPEGVVRYQSPSVERVFGYSPEEVESDGLFRSSIPTTFRRCLPRSPTCARRTEAHAALSAG
jgi:PAS domain-containing protein